MASVHDVAAAILRRHFDDPRFGQITTMKLHKLVYASQGIHLARHGSPEFDGELEAWDGGPVEPDLYRTFAGRRYLSRDDLRKLGDEGNLSYDESAAVDDALDMYGSFSGDALSDLSHSEAPWREAYYGRGKNAPLLPDLMRQFFAANLEECDQRDADSAVEQLLSMLDRSV